MKSLSKVLTCPGFCRPDIVEEKKKVNNDKRSNNNNNNNDNINNNLFSLITKYNLKLNQIALHYLNYLQSEQHIVSFQFVELVEIK